ncbi:mechanosensitive ion channel family protein [soil metagenome]
MFCLSAFSTAAGAQPAGSPERPQSVGKEPTIPAPPRVDVKPVAEDEAIRNRLQDIMDATGWFPSAQVMVKNGVVFLSGQATTDELKQWASDLARNTQGVVAVANRMEAVQPSAWNFAAAQEGIAQLQHDVVRALPFLVLGLVVLALSVGASWLAMRGARGFVRKRIRSKLMQGVFAWTAATIVLFAGLYIVLRISGLTQLALTVVGGTGLIGLALGIAFRNITENFLASIFLSMQRPFATGDLIGVAGEIGYVQQLNVRSTVLMTLEGNIVQVPNATMYQQTLRNFTTSPNRREHFVVGIGYDDAIDEAQEVARRVLDDHPAVLQEPEPLVLVDNLGKATVDMKVYFWLDGNEHSAIKVRSSVIRLIKRAFQKHGISMPDEAREVVFPQSVPVIMVDGKQATAPAVPQPVPSEPDDSVSTKAEAGLSSEAATLHEQARRARPPEQGENLLSRPAPS